jgi:hypothetical protein
MYMLYLKSSGLDSQGCGRFLPCETDPVKVFVRNSNKIEISPFTAYQNAIRWTLLTRVNA